MLTVEAASGEFGIHVRTIYRLLADGKLTRYRKRGDRRTYVDREELKAALGFRAVSGPGAPQSR